MVATTRSRPDTTDHPEADQTSTTLSSPRPPQPSLRRHFYISRLAGTIIGVLLLAVVVTALGLAGSSGGGSTAPTNAPEALQQLNDAAKVNPDASNAPVAAPVAVDPEASLPADLKSQLHKDDTFLGYAKDLVIIRNYALSTSRIDLLDQVWATHGPHYQQDVQAIQDGSWSELHLSNLQHQYPEDGLAVYTATGSDASGTRPIRLLVDPSGPTNHLADSSSL